MSNKPLRPRLRTNVATAHWCNPAKGHLFEPATIHSHDSQRMLNASWLDRLLGGGIVLPDLFAENRRAVTMLLTGPPGTGKSTLALEICLRAEKAKPPSLRTHDEPPRSLYLTSEAHTPWLIQNAESFGWLDDRKSDIASADAASPAPDGARPRVRIMSIDEAAAHAMLSERGASQGAPSAWSIGAWLDEVSKLFGTGIGPRQPADAVAPPVPTPALAAQLRESAPDILVLDSLNTIVESRAQLFAKFLAVARGGPALVLIVLDSGSENQRPEFWEYCADIVVRLDHEHRDRYFVRYLEIVKCRYQLHAWGRHQMKIYERSSNLVKAPVEPIATDAPPDERALRAALASERMRSHPYRYEGGIFIFPSIHYQLSTSKRRAYNQVVKEIPSGLQHLSNLLYRGYPAGRCVGLIGGRGGHKSHLAYVETLYRLRTIRNSKALVLSLRDDEGMTRKTMAGILKGQWGCETPEQTLWEYETAGRLEITYYPPGAITPEEFFHRLLLSINRLRHCEPAHAASLTSAAGRDEEPQITLMFNSLDQLASRFPLCAREPVFVMSIIELLSRENISSFFVSADDDETDLHGLMSMAELLIRHSGCDVEDPEDYAALVKQACFATKGDARKAGTRRDGAKLPTTRIRTTRLEIVRYAGGQAAGAAGFLELMDEPHPQAHLFHENLRGLLFMPLDKQYVTSPDEDRPGA